MIAFLKIKIDQLLHFPHFFILFCKDFYLWIKSRGWRKFEGWGLHMYVGMFGSGKTSSMVDDAYWICRRYPSVSVLSNFALYDFPDHTNIYPLSCVDDILNAPDNTLVLIDEIGTVFNSRDFLGGKGVPKLLFQHICQCRKRNIQIYGTTQRWNFLDKQLRDITATVVTTHMFAAHPFSRLATLRKYDAVDYDLAFNNPVFQPKIIASRVYVQTDRRRGRYDTSELVNTILSASYLSDAETMQNRGDMAQMPIELSRQANRKVRKRSAF